MRVPLGNDEWCLCDSSEPPDHECMQFEGNETIALRWASQFHGDLFAQRTMRRLLGSTIPPRSDEQVAREVAWRLARGVWTAHRPVIEIPTADRGVPQEAPVAFPQQERRGWLVRRRRGARPPPATLLRRPKRRSFPPISMHWRSPKRRSGRPPTVCRSARNASAPRCQWQGKP
jgi:hypothetical protein